MKLLTKEILRKLPALGCAKEPIKVPLKLFMPSGRATWYVTEYDGKDLLFGFMASPLGSDCDELGYSSLSEIMSVKGRFGLGVERDLHWNSNTTLADVMSGKVR